MDDNKYDDIINLPYHKSDKRHRMTNYERAAQFSSFAALTGYKEAIKETARLTDSLMLLDENKQEELNNKLQILLHEINQNKDIAIAITYFKPDENKSGGEYLTVNAGIKKIDEYKKIIILADETIVDIESIIEIESELFQEYNF